MSSFAEKRRKDARDADSILYGDEIVRGTSDTAGLITDASENGLVKYYDGDDRLVKIIVPAGMTYRIGDVEWTAYGETEAWLDADGRLHRDQKEGPAMIADGTSWWYQHGRLHRDDGPAVAHHDGTKEYYRDGLPHREDGPAIEYADGGRSYCLDGHLFRTSLSWYDYKAWKALTPAWQRDDSVWQRVGIYLQRVEN